MPEIYEKEILVLEAITDKLYKKYWMSGDINDSIWNYTNQVQTLLCFFDNTELYKRWMEKLENLLSDKLSLDNFKQLRTAEKEKLSVLIKQETLSEDGKKKIVILFKEFIKDLDNT